MNFASLVCATACLCTASSLSAAVRLPAVFSDHMVLQREQKIPVWGWASPGEKVTVTFAGKSVLTQTDASGNWRVDLEPSKANALPQAFKVEGTNTIEFQDVLVGDVWLCAGQSNMGFWMEGASTASQDIPLANDPQLRLFHTAEKTAPEPQKEIPLANRKQWVPCSPDEVKHFSAVGYYFGRELRKHVNVPMGLISCTQGGSAIQLWTSMDAIEKNVDADPQFKEWIEKTRKMKAEYPARAVDYGPKRAAWEQEVKKWREEVELAPEFVAKQNAWAQERQKAIEEGKVPPPKPQPARPRPTPPEAPDYGPHNLFTAGTLYNALIAPFIPYAIKGVAWYQGESNDYDSKQYSVLFPLLIQDWRIKWGEGNFPFLFVQLPNIGKPPTAPVPEKDRWPAMREAQAKALSLPNTGMASIIDVGDPNDIHGKDKLDPGVRLSLVACKLVYGQGVVASGPTYDSMKVNGNKIVVSFKNIGGGLEIGVPPWTPSGKIPPVANELKGFIITGSAQKWVWAQARIAGDTVEVSSPEVPAPVAVRYGWADNPPCNLYNKARLPAVPFRTDNW